jgi:hypothetical protein
VQTGEESNLFAGLFCAWRDGYADNVELVDYH